jgi:CRISPR-associated endonuclease Cas3-HD
MGEETLQVVLRFSPSVRRRVLETTWHPSQVTSEDPEKPGWLRWEVQVADTLDLVPWVRGWGADCEVLEPEELRHVISKGVLKMAQLYKIEGLENVPKYLHLWAKANRKHPEQIHRLIYHLIDVGMVAKVLWQTSLPSQLKARLAQWLDLSVDDAGQLLAFWAALHDLGKASPAFQFKLAHIVPQLREQGFQLRDHFDQPTHHEVITAWAIQFEKLLEDETGLEAHWAQRVAQALGGHHGAWHPYNEIANVPDSERGAEEWAAARRALVYELKMIFAPPACQSDLTTVEQNAFLTVFSGFVSVVDWIGSDESLFRYNDSFMPLARYAICAEKQAQAG